MVQARALWAFSAGLEPDDHVMGIFVLWELRGRSAGQSRTLAAQGHPAQRSDNSEIDNHQIGAFPAHQLLQPHPAPHVIARLHFEVAMPYLISLSFSRPAGAGVSPCTSQQAVFPSTRHLAIAGLPERHQVAFHLAAADVDWDHLVEHYLAARNARGPSRNMMQKQPVVSRPLN